LFLGCPTDPPKDLPPLLFIPPCVSCRLKGFPPPIRPNFSPVRFNRFSFRLVPSRRGRPAPPSRPFRPFDLRNFPDLLTGPPPFPLTAPSTKPAFQVGAPRCPTCFPPFSLVPIVGVAVCPFLEFPRQLSGCFSPKNSTSGPNFFPAPIRAF